MPKVAQFKVIHAGSFTLPSVFSGSERHIQFGDLPNVAADEHAVVTFRVDPSSEEAVQLRVQVNNRHIMGESGIMTFKSDPARSWHEIVPPNILKPTGNELVVSVERSSGPGQIQIADIVLSYQVNLASDNPSGSIDPPLQPT